jgi:hypothetical protein
VLLAHRGAVWCRADRAALNGAAMRSHSPEPSAALDERHVLKQAAMFISPMSAFAPHCGLKSDIAPCRKSAMCGRLRVGKRNIHVCRLGRCCHVFGL